MQSWYGCYWRRAPPFIIPAIRAATLISGDFSTTPPRVFERFWSVRPHLEPNEIGTEESKNGNRLYVEVSPDSAATR